MLVSIRASKNGDMSSEAPVSETSTAGKEWDYIIVGGGSAGCALANRLSADSNNKVLVLEAGRPDYKWDIFIHMPAALTFPIGSRLYDWKYESEPEPQMNGRRVYHARGKVLGGSSSINGMIFQRGSGRWWRRFEGFEGVCDPSIEQRGCLLAVEFAKPESFIVSGFGHQQALLLVPTERPMGASATL